MKVLILKQKTFIKTKHGLKYVTHVIMEKTAFPVEGRQELDGWL